MAGFLTLEFEPEIENWLLILPVSVVSEPPSSSMNPSNTTTEI